MSQGSKIFLGICTFLPFILGFVLVFGYMSAILDVVQAAGTSSDPHVVMPALFSKIFTGPVIAILMLLVITKLSLLVYYIVHVVSNGTKDEKVMWILLFVLIGSIPFIVYYFVKIVPSKPRDGVAMTV